MNARDVSSAQAALAIAGVVSDGDAAPALLFRRAGENYSEGRRCAGTLVSIGDGVTLRFALPIPDCIDFALLLLPALPGVYAIHRLEVGGEVVADLARRVICAHERLEPAAAPQEVRYASERGRPTIEVDLRGLGALSASGSTEVLVAIRREASFAALDRLGDRVAGVSARVHDLASEVGGILLGQGEHLYQLGAAGTQQAARIEARITEAQAELIGSVEYNAGRIQTAIADGKASHDRRFEAIDAAIADSNALLAELAQRLERLQAQTDRMVHAVENVFWRRWLQRLRGSRG